MTNFVSVGTAAARFQDISLNPQKLAGQCAKLKCCLNFEVDAYVESIKHLPPKDIRLETADNTYYHFKYDVFNRTVTYSTDKSVPANLITLTADRAFEVIAMNKAGEKPLTLLPESEANATEKKPYADLLGQDSIARFDNAKKKKKRKPKSKQPKEGTDAPQPTQPQGQQRQKSDENRSASKSPKNRPERRPQKNGSDRQRKPDRNRAETPGERNGNGNQRREERRQQPQSQKQKNDQ